MLPSMLFYHFMAVVCNRCIMATKLSTGDGRTRSFVSIFIVVGLCCFFYLLGAWQRSGFGKGDSIALEMTKSGADCSVLTKPYPDPVADLVVGGLLAAHAQKWTKHRKIISPAFHLEKLKCMLPAINLSCDDMIKKWEILVSTNGYAEVDVWPYLEDLSGDMISRAAFGSNLEEGRIIFQLHKEQTNLGFKMMGLSYTKAFRPWFFPPAKPDKRMIQIHLKCSSKYLFKVFNPI